MATYQSNCGGRLGYNPRPQAQRSHTPLATVLIQVRSRANCSLSLSFFFESCVLQNQLFLGSQNEEMLPQQEGGGTNGTFSLGGHMESTI